MKIPVSVYQPLPLGGHPVAVNKYHIMSYHSNILKPEFLAPS